MPKHENEYELPGKRDYCPECGQSRIIYSLGNLDDKVEVREWKIRCGYCSWHGHKEELLNGEQADKLKERLQNEREQATSGNHAA